MYVLYMFIYLQICLDVFVCVCVCADVIFTKTSVLAGTLSCVYVFTLFLNGFCFVAFAKKRVCLRAHPNGSDLALTYLGVVAAGTLVWL